MARVFVIRENWDCYLPLTLNKYICIQILGIPISRNLIKMKNPQGYKTIIVKVSTKNRLEKAKQTGESYGDTIDRLILENKKIVLEA